MSISLSDEVESALSGLHLIHTDQSSTPPDPRFRRVRCGLVVNILDTVAYSFAADSHRPVCITCRDHILTHPIKFVPPKGLGE